MELAVTIEDVISAKPELIYYSANTIWWTHDSNDLCKPTQEHLEKMKQVFGELAVQSFEENPVPLDAFNSPLYQTENYMAFADAKRVREHEAYGPNPQYRVETFMWSHAKNMALILDVLKERAKENKKVITRFQNFHELLVELGIFNKQ